jgi:hypothetical protein
MSAVTDEDIARARAEGAAWRSKAHRRKADRGDAPRSGKRIASEASTSVVTPAMGESHVVLPPLGDGRSAATHEPYELTATALSLISTRSSCTSLDLEALLHQSSSSLMTTPATVLQRTGSVAVLHERAREACDRRAHASGDAA